MPDGASAAGGPSLLMRLNANARALLAFVAGVLAGLGHVPYSIVPVSVVGFALALLLLLDVGSRRRAFLTGWLAGTGYFLVTLFWIVEPFQIDVDTHGWMAPFALFFLATGLALFWGLAGFLSALFSAPGGWARAAAAAVALTLTELSRAYVFTGFPWVLPGYIWVETGTRGWASIVGPHGLTLLTLVLAATLAVFIGYRASRLQAGVAGAVLLVALVAIGPSFLPDTATSQTDRPIVRIVQPNAPQNEKWDPTLAVSFVRRQILFTAEPADPVPDLIVWPETAIPWLLDRAGPVLAEISAAADDVPVILGVQRLEDGRYFNGLALLGPSGVPVQTYDKHHLVPFGEYMPFPELARRTGIRGIAERSDGSYTPGPGPALLDLGALGLALPLICYEVIFPQNVRGAPDRPDFLVNITNDAWFGQFSGPHQHLAQARMRAVEFGLPMVRSANTGVSAMIDSAGHVLNEIPMGEAGYMDVALPPASPITLYARLGDLPVFVLLLVSVSGLLVQRLRNSH